MLDDLRKIVAAMHERPGHVLAVEAVSEKDGGYDGERQAHQPARALEHQSDHHGADDKVGNRVKAARTQQKFLVEDPVVDAGQEAENAERPQDGAHEGGVGFEIAEESKS